MCCSIILYTALFVGETKAHDTYDCNEGCPVEAALEVIGGKWKGVILYHLESRVYRFNELRRLMPGVTQRMLTKQLRELESDGLIQRTVFAEVPPKVEYTMTPYGATLTPVLRALQAWGSEHLRVRAGTGQEGAVKHQDV